MRFACSYAVLTEPAKGTDPASVRASHAMASEVCPGCQEPIGFERPYLRRGCAVHLPCLVATLVGGAPPGALRLKPRPVRPSSVVSDPPPTFNLPDSRGVEPCAPASTLATSQAVA